MLLPLLERDYNPQIRAQLVQLAEQCQVDGAWLADAARRSWRRLVKKEGDTLTFNAEALRRLPEGLQRHLVRTAIGWLQGDLAGFEFRHWVEIRRLLRDKPVGTVVDLAHGIQVVRCTPQQLLVRRRADGPRWDGSQGPSTARLAAQTQQGYTRKRRLQRDICRREKEFECRNLQAANGGSSSSW